MMTQHILTEEERKNIINCLKKSQELCIEIERGILDYRIENGIDSGIVFRSEQDEYLTKIQHKADECDDMLYELIRCLNI